MFLIVGAGFLGTYLIRQLSAQFRGPILATVRDTASVVPFPKTEYVAFDVTDETDVRRLAKRCGGGKLTVFYFAALHNVDYLYTHREEGENVNLTALARFLDAVPGIEKFFFASTDCVYGENAPGSQKFKETDECKPINVYGAQKLEAEKIVRAHGFTAVRFSYMMGPSLTKKRHFYDTLEAKLKAGEPVEMLDGMVRSALSYKTAALLLAELSALPAGVLPDTVNLCSDGAFTKYDLGLKIAADCGVSPALVKKIPESAGEAFFKDRRASRAVMDNARLKALLGLSHIGFEEVTRC
ncbi:MAG: sugar nucleotide-binding protein [Clostridia bacterium]|nr:sugar nucleotide-binding protein [Clostridia bacterium]